VAFVSLDSDRLEEVKAAVGAGLVAHNNQFLPKDREQRSIAVSIREDDGRVVGGLIGKFRMDWLYVDWLWIDDSLRGQGYGAQLLNHAEQEARLAGMTHVFLWTWSFQAPKFYTAQGYTECGRITDHPRGYDNIQFVKWLS
jgi:GNAT superfamily N-acetyltransferase